MTIGNVGEINQALSFPCLKDGLVTIVGVSCTLTADKVHPVGPWLTAMGVSTNGAVLAIYDAGTNSPAMTVNGVGAGIVPYLDFDNQTLEFRRLDTGDVDAVNTAITDPDRAKFWLVVRA